MKSLRHIEREMNVSVDELDEAMERALSDEVQNFFAEFENKGFSIGEVRYLFPSTTSWGQQVRSISHLARIIGASNEITRRVLAAGRSVEWLLRRYDTSNRGLFLAYSCYEYMSALDDDNSGTVSVGREIPVGELIRMHRGSLLCSKW